MEGKGDGGVKVQCGDDLIEEVTGEDIQKRMGRTIDMVGVQR